VVRPAVNLHISVAHLPGREFCVWCISKSDLAYNRQCFAVGCSSGQYWNDFINATVFMRSSFLWEVNLSRDWKAPITDEAVDCFFPSGCWGPGYYQEIIMCGLILIVIKSIMFCYTSMIKRPNNSTAEVFAYCDSTGIFWVWKLACLLVLALN